jgi:hypothetical protein
MSNFMTIRPTDPQMRKEGQTERWPDRQTDGRMDGPATGSRFLQLCERT